MVIRLSAMGDVAMTVPVLRALTEQHPELKITVLTRPFYKPFYRDLEQVDVYPVDLKDRHKGLLGLYKLASELNERYRFYAVADLHNVLRSNILKRFIKCPLVKTLDKGRREKKKLISGEIFKQLKTTHQRYADVFSVLGFPVDLSRPNFPKPVELNGKLQELVGADSKKIIGIAPFAAHEGKMYPLNLMEEVIEGLSRSYKILLFGGGSEEIAKLNEFEKRFQNTINLAGKLTLNEELDIISNLDVMLAMDSGNGHMAAMLGVKVITIWGVTHPYAGFAPFNQPENYMLLADREKYPEIPTSVYGNKLPKGYKSVMNTISYEDIVKKIDKVLS